jgi:hypothetical protein
VPVGARRFGTLPVRRSARHAFVIFLTKALAAFQLRAKASS